MSGACCALCRQDPDSGHGAAVAVGRKEKSTGIPLRHIVDARMLERHARGQPRIGGEPARLDHRLASSHIARVGACAFSDASRPG